MPIDARCADYLALPRCEREALFLDVLKTPPFRTKGSWGEWFHAWLEDQCAEGRWLGEIARRIDLPVYYDDGGIDSWQFLERHVCWLISQGYARVVRVQIIA